jgi:histidine triad (HIT) family protein
MVNQTTECVLCKIVKAEIPANNKEYEDENCMVVHDIAPQAPLHLLVISKKHGIEFLSTPPEFLSSLLAVSAQMISAKDVAQSYKIVVNGGDATLVRDHLHIHVLSDLSK